MHEKPFLWLTGSVFGHSWIQSTSSWEQCVHKLLSWPLHLFGLLHLSMWQINKDKWGKELFGTQSLHVYQAGSRGAAFRVSGSGSRVLCQLLNLCWHWADPSQGTRMGSSLRPLPPATGSESHNCQIISVSLCLRHSCADYICPQCKRRWRMGRKADYMANCLGRKEGFHLSRSDHNKAAILGDWSQTTAAVISHPSISFRHIQPIPEQKNHLLQRSGAGKAVSDFLTLFFKILISSPLGFLTAAAQPSPDNI